MRKGFLLAVLVGVMVVLACITVFSGCKKRNVQYTVTFIIGDYNVDKPADMVVKAGSKITAPDTDITPADGYRAAWYTDSDKTVLFDFDTPINSNMTLYLGEDGIIYSITYVDINEEWFNIASLPTSYKAGVGVAIPEPKASKFVGYDTGHWYDGERLVSYFGVPSTEFGDLTLRFVAEPREYQITYTNAGYIGITDYRAYITNDNPLIYRVTDGVVILSAPEIDPACPLPIPVFSKWVLVAQSDHNANNAIRDITEITVELVTSRSVYIRAVWIYAD